MFLLLHVALVIAAAVQHNKPVLRLGKDNEFPGPVLVVKSLIRKWIRRVEVLENLFWIIRAVLQPRIDVVIAGGGTEDVGSECLFDAMHRLPSISNCLWCRLVSHVARTKQQVGMDASRANQFEQPGNWMVPRKPLGLLDLQMRGSSPALVGLGESMQIASHSYRERRRSNHCGGCSRPASVAFVTRTSRTSPRCRPKPATWRLTSNVRQCQSRNNSRVRREYE